MDLAEYCRPQVYKAYDAHRDVHVTVHALSYADAREKFWKESPFFWYVTHVCSAEPERIGR